VVGGSITSGNSFGDVLKTTDGGSTWTRLPFSSSTRAYSVCFTDENTGFVGVDGPTGVYKTTDAGQNWNSLNTGTGVSGNSVYDIDFMNGNTGFAAYGNGQIAKTTDGGSTWSSVSAGFGAAACYEIFIVNPSIIYALGPGGRISKSTDGGNAFLQLPSLGTATLYSTHFFSPDTGFIVGSSGKIWKTVNGYNFTEITSPVTTTIYVIRFTDRQTGWFGDSGGNIYYTLDGGTTWIKSRIAIGSSQSTRDIQIKDGSLWVIGTDGMIMKGLSDPNVPVELTSFNAEVNSQLVTLNWVTASEKNNRGFEVERRIETTGYVSPEEWTKIGFVKGAGTSIAGNNYTFTDMVTGAGVAAYRLKQIDFDGSYKYVASTEVKILPINSFVLGQNYPNPFGKSPGAGKSTTLIRYTVPESFFPLPGKAAVSGGNMVMVHLMVYDLLGREVATLVRELKQPGHYEAEFDGSGLPAGVYIYQLQAGGSSAARKMTLLR